jgi:hypothetical protein
MREKYTALWPVPVILSTLLFRDSLSTTPTLALARGHAKQTRAIARPDENSMAPSAFLVRLLANPRNCETKMSLDNENSPLFSKVGKSPICSTHHHALVACRLKCAGEAWIANQAAKSAPTLQRMLALSLEYGNIWSLSTATRTHDILLHLRAPCSPGPQIPCTSRELVQFQSRCVLLQCPEVLQPVSSDDSWWPLTGLEREDVGRRREYWNLPQALPKGWAALNLQRHLQRAFVLPTWIR